MSKIFQIIMPKGAMGYDESDDKLDTFLRTFSEKNQEEGQWGEKYGIDFENDKVLMKTYCWCERETCPYCFDLNEGIVTEEMKMNYGIEIDKVAPNFWYKPLDFKVWWYKYIGRSMEVNKQLSDVEFNQMIADCL